VKDLLGFVESGLIVYVRNALAYGSESGTGGEK
jgi:hypothetical protein